LIEIVPESRLRHRNKDYDVRYIIGNKSSAVTDMGDPLATIDMGQKVGAAVPLSVGGARLPSNTLWLGLVVS